MTQYDFSTQKELFNISCQILSDRAALDNTNEVVAFYEFIEPCETFMKNWENTASTLLKTMGFPTKMYLE